MSTQGEGALFKSGDILDKRYRVLSVLGSGGMGKVLKVQDIVLDDELVALKILSPEYIDDPIQLGRFRYEVVLARRLSHPNIVRIYDIGSCEFEYFTMEYVEGSTLKNFIEEHDVRDIAPALLSSILIQLLQGLSYAHQKGIVHRDLKPENILYSTNRILKVTDLGLSCAADSTKNFTKTGETVGTPYYMSPELLAGEGADRRTDIYSLGIIAYEMACKVKPFRSENYLELAHMHMTLEPVDISKINPMIPKWYREFVHLCLRKKKEERFQSMDDALQFLYEKADAPVREQIVENPYTLDSLGLL